MLAGIKVLRSSYAESTESQSYLRTPRWRRLLRPPALLLSVLLFLVISPAFAQAPEQVDFDQYSVRVTGFWFQSSPTVSLEAGGHNGFIDFNHDFDFNEYSTFLGKLDWKFTRKNHLYFSAVPFNQSSQVVLSHTITFRGQTYF